MPRLFREVAGECVPFEVISVGRWTARNVVADRYQVGRVFFAGDAAHLNHPASGLGLNTGLGDATNIGWKLSAVVQGWGGEGLLASYEAERRPVAVHNVKHAENMNKNDRGQNPPAYIGDDTPEGETARREMGERISEKLKLKFITTGIAIGYRYADSPICAKDTAAPPVQSVTEYEPGTYPGVRAPHAWVSGDCSTLDLFGKGFTLLSFTQESRDIAALQAAFDRRGAPLLVQAISRADIRTLYECDLVLVRPDGHVAWRGSHVPENTESLAALVCGATCA